MCTACSISRRKQRFLKKATKDVRSQSFLKKQNKWENSGFSVLMFLVFWCLFQTCIYCIYMQALRRLPSVVYTYYILLSPKGLQLRIRPLNIIIWNRSKMLLHLSVIGSLFLFCCLHMCIFSHAIEQLCDRHNVSNFKLHWFVDWSKSLGMFCAWSLHLFFPPPASLLIEMELLIPIQFSGSCGKKLFL